MINLNAALRFMDKVVIQDSGCWEFDSCIGRNGYARFKLAGRLRLAHRVSYEMYVGGIPKGLHLHHTCEVKNCVNPAHLQPATPKEHIVYLSPNAPAFKRRHATHCLRGHELTTENVYLTAQGWRSCKICKHLRWLQFKESR